MEQQIDKLVARLIKKKREKSQVTNIQSEIRTSLQILQTQNGILRNIIREYYFMTINLIM